MLRLVLRFAILLAAFYFASAPSAVVLKPIPAVTVPVHIRFDDEGLTLPDLVQAAQIQVDAELQNLNISNWNVRLVDELERSRPVNGIKYILPSNVYSLLLMTSRENSIGVDSEGTRAYLFYNFLSVESNDLPFYLAQTTIHHFLRLEIDFFQDHSHKIDFRLEINVNFVTLDSNIEEKEWETTLEQIYRPFEETFAHEIGLKINLKRHNGSYEDPSESANEFTFYCTLGVSQSSEKYRHIASIDDLRLFVHNSLSSIAYRMGVPVHPDNNLGLKLKMLKRVLSVRNLLTVRQLSHIGHELSTDYNKLVADLEAQDKLITIGQWDRFYNATNDLVDRVSRIENSEAAREEEPLSTSIQKKLPSTLGFGLLFGLTCIF